MAAQVWVIALFCLAGGRALTVPLPGLGRRQPRTLQCRHLSAMTEGEFGWNDMGTSSGRQSLSPPGHISTTPVSTSGSGRIEMGRALLSVAVVWLTIKIKLKEVFEKIQLNNVTELDVNEKKIVALAGGVKFQDTQVGEIAPTLGDPLQLEARIFHNGLEITNFGGQSFENGLQLPFYYGADEKELQALLPETLEGLPRATAGMRIDGKRQVVLPCEAGITPYVPKGGKLLCSVTLSKRP